MKKYTILLIIGLIFIIDTSLILVIGHINFKPTDVTFYIAFLICVIFYIDILIYSNVTTIIGKKIINKYIKNNPNIFSDCNKLLEVTSTTVVLLDWKKYLDYSEKIQRIIFGETYNLFYLSDEFTSKIILKNLEYGNNELVFYNKIKSL